MTNSGIGGRAIDRCSPHLRDPLREKSLPQVLPNKPKNFNQRGKKSTHTDPASSRRYLLSDGDSEDFSEQESVDFVTVNEQLRFQPSKVEELFDVVEEYPSMFQSVELEESSKKPSLPPSSAPKTTNELQVEEQYSSRLQGVKAEEAKEKSLSASSSTKRAKEQQVVVLRVSLHCKGCEGKVRKHISKMEGVTSFSTDLVNKKVMVVGEVTPLGVLNSISKVKNAKLWPS